MEKPIDRSKEILERLSSIYDLTDPYFIEEKWQDQDECYGYRIKAESCI